MKKLLLTAVIACVLLSCKKNCPQEVNIIEDKRIDWPTFHGNNQRTAFLPISMNIAGKTKWEFLGDNDFFGGIVVDATTVYGATTNGTLFAIDKFNKQPKWSFAAGGSIFGSPALDSATIYFGSDDKKHLHLLAKIAHLSSKPESIQLLLSKPSKEQLLDYIKNWESSISRTKN